jgi:semaphorin 6
MCNALINTFSLILCLSPITIIAISPYSPNQNNTYIYTGDINELYTATSVGFAGSQQLIYRQPLLTTTPNSYGGSAPQTLRTESRFDILNQASFVNALEYNGYILFFFREQAIEYQNCGKTMYSRVARVCKNDKGGQHSYADRFSSFLKTRLNCSMPGEYPFYFDEIQATSALVDGIYGNDRDALVYTVMTTNENAIDGSAICVFSMNSILAGFEGRFKSQRDMNSNWRAVDESELPSPRPGKCTDDSRTLPMSTINFILKNPLMNGAINPIHDSPLLVHTGSNYKFTSIAVDPQVETASGKIYDIVFVGTDNGQVLKMINAGDSLGENKPIVISEQQVLPYGTRIKELKVSKASQTLIIIADDYVKTIPLHNCSGLSQCSRCIGSRDPYCVWDNINRECIFHNKTSMNKNSQIYVESIDGRNDVICGEDVVVPPSKNNNLVKSNANTNTNNHVSSSQTHGVISGNGHAPSETENNQVNEVHHKYSNVHVVQGTFLAFTAFFLREIIEALSQLF